jgi:L,D-transpeptidase catalytic domain
MAAARGIVALGTGIALAMLPAPPAGAREVRPVGATSPHRSERLSDERTVTRWAHALRTTPIRARPLRRSPAVASLRALTEDGLPEVYMALRSLRARGDRIWVRVRVPGRPNGRKGWVPRGALGHLHVVTTALRIDKGRSRATLRRRGRIVWRSPIGHGAPGTPTPAGRFYIRERLDNRGGDPVYGPLAFGTSAYSALSEWPGGGVIGIHGTDQPWLIPGRPSHGCIRVPNRAIRRLARLMPIGTPVRIR